MLAVKSYPTDYVESCRATVRADRAAYDGLGLSADQRAAFEPGYARARVLALDHLFTHRMRGQEGKGTLHEVRVLCEAIREGTAPALSLDEVDRLTASFLTEIEERFPA